MAQLQPEPEPDRPVRSSASRSAAPESASSEPQPASSGQANEAAEGQSADSPAPESGTSDAGDDTGTGPSGPQGDDADDPRRVAHELLGQTHAFFVLAQHEQSMSWYPEAVKDAIRGTLIPVSLAIGEAQAEVASGRHDEGLKRVGIGGPLARPKRGLLRHALEHLSKAFTARSGERIRSWLKVAAGATETIVSSLAHEIPGMEVVAEAVGGIGTAVEAWEAWQLDPDTHPIEI